MILSDHDREKSSLYLKSICINSLSAYCGFRVRHPHPTPPHPLKQVIKISHVTLTWLNFFLWVCWGGKGRGRGGMGGVGVWWTRGGLPWIPRSKKAFLNWHTLLHDSILAHILENLFLACAVFQNTIFFCCFLVLLKSFQGDTSPKQLFRKSGTMFFGVSVCLVYNIQEQLFSQFLTSWNKRRNLRTFLERGRTLVCRGFTWPRSWQTWNVFA